MKRVDFVPGFPELRGNVSGKQKLEYAENDNPAYDGPVGQKNYARNYKAAIVVSKRASDGRMYFSVRTKTANHLTSRAKKAMALLGGAGAVYAAIVRTKSTATYQGIYAQWAKLVEYGSTKTFRQWVMDTIRTALMSNAQNCVFTGPLSPVTVKNPWYDGSQSADATISNANLVKFWGELHTNGIYFTVGGAKGIATTGDEFQSIINSHYNVLSLVANQQSYITMGGNYLITALGAGVRPDDVATDGAVFTLSSSEPE